jgi:hypothetical protein
MGRREPRNNDHAPMLWASEAQEAIQLAEKVRKLVLKLL